MADGQEGLFAAVDALLEKAAETALPNSAERKRLREAGGLSQEDIASALGVRRETVTSWEAGRSEPRAPKRAAYIRLLKALAARHPEAEPRPTAPATRPAAQAPVQSPPVSVAVPVPAPDSVPPPDPDPVSASATTPAPDRASAARAAAATPAAPRRAAAQKHSAKKPAPVAPDADPRFAHGPLAVLDGAGRAYCVGGLILDCPAGNIPSLVDWALTEAGLGAPRLHRNGRDSDPLIVLTGAAAERFGLPSELEDRRTLRLPQDHLIVKQIARAKWQLTKRGFGPWARIYRPAQGGRRHCAQLAVVPWGAFDVRAWGDTASLPPAELARVLGDYANRVITPRGSTAVSGLELMTALRPPTRAVQDAATGAWVSGPMPDALTRPVDPAPPEAPDEHPVVAQLFPRNHQRTPDQVLDEEAYDWIRDPQLLTDEECAKPYAVGIDVNTAFLAAANRLYVGLGEPVHVEQPVFDKKLPGCWLVDLSSVAVDPRLPSPFTPHGGAPTGPAWYATPTVAYAQELIGLLGLTTTVQPIEAYVRPENGPYLDPWYARLSEAYKATMAGLGVVAGMSEPDYLAAMEHHRTADPGQAAVLAAIKATVKGGIGKLRERPQGAKYRPGERWPALERPTWRPDVRAAVISAARVNMHRKMFKTAAAGLYPIAVLSDCAVYVSDGPSPLDFLPRTPDGKPPAGTFRLGVSPGMTKTEGVQPFLWAARMLDEGHNPARHIKGTDAKNNGE